MKSIVVFMLIVCLAVSANAAKKYWYFRVGNANDVTTAATLGTVLMGGGADIDALLCGCAAAAAIATSS